MHTRHDPPGGGRNPRRGPMSETNRASPIRFYFSFRSPYAWLAAEKLDATLGDLAVAVERIPIYPTPEEFPNDPAALPAAMARSGSSIRAW